jgi:hypothetical protein
MKDNSKGNNSIRVAATVPPRMGRARSLPPDRQGGVSLRRGQYGGDVAIQALAATIG